MDIAEVYWRDSRMFIAQCSKEDDLEVCDMRSVGFILPNKDGRSLILAGDLVDGEFRRVLVIPTENIVNLYINGKLHEASRNNS